MGQVLLPEEGRGGAPDLSFIFLKFRGRKGQGEEEGKHTLLRDPPRL